MKKQVFYPFLSDQLNQRRIFKVKYLGPTNYKGSRIKLTNIHSETSAIYPYDYRFNNIHDMATDIIENTLTYLKVTDVFYDKNSCYLIAKNY